MTPQIGQVVTVFRSRLRPEAVDEYGPDAARIERYYAAYSIQVGTTSYASALPAS